MKYFVFFSLLLFLAPNVYTQDYGTIQGTITDKISNEFIIGATVGIQSSSKGVISDFDGKFLIEDLPVGLYNLEVRYLGYEVRVLAELEVSHARPVVLTIELMPTSINIEDITVVADAFEEKKASPLSLRNIGVNEIKRNPGGNRDISKVVQVLPGVASTPTFRNDLIIRGGAPSENKFYIDGIEIPVINHFSTQGSSGGPVGMVNVDLVKSVDLYSAAFPVNYGNALSSVFDFSMKKGNSIKLESNFVIGSSDIGLFIDGPINKNTTFNVSVRRSYLKFLFTILDLPFLPTYNDAQFKIVHQPNQKHSFTFLGIGAIDDFVLNEEANETESQQYILNNVPVNGQNNGTLGFKYTRFFKKAIFKTVLSGSFLHNEAYKYANNDASSQENLILDYDSKENYLKWRNEIETFNTNGMNWIAGFSAERVGFEAKSFSKFVRNGAVFTSEFDADFSFIQYGVFANARRSFFKEQLSLSVGARLDGADLNDDLRDFWNQFSPRLSARWTVAPQFFVNFNAGFYYQLPALTLFGYQEDGIYVNQPRLNYINCQQLVAGLEWKSKTNARITLEGFYKDYDNYPFSITDSINLANLGGDFGVIGYDQYVSSGYGKSYGLELLIQQKFLKNYYGLLSYTLSWSEFNDKNDTQIPSSWDTRHIFNITGGIRFKNNWEIGAKWRFSSGSPYTPYNEDISSIRENWDVSNAGILDFNQLNSKRIDAIHSLDVRVDKRYFFKTWNLNPYFDVQNIYNQEVQGQPYLTVRRDESGIPFVDPNDNSRYVMSEIENSIGLLQPSIGVIFEF